MCVSHTIPNKRCHIEVGAPAKQDCRAAQRRHMSRRPRTETSPWYVDPWSPLCPSIADHHGIDERSMHGVCPDTRAGTKRGVCHPPYIKQTPHSVRQHSRQEPEPYSCGGPRLRPFAPHMVQEPREDGAYNAGNCLCRALWVSARHRGQGASTTRIASPEVCAICAGL